MKSTRSEFPRSDQNLELSKLVKSPTEHSRTTQGPPSLTLPYWKVPVFNLFSCLFNQQAHQFIRLQTQEGNVVTQLGRVLEAAVDTQFTLNPSFPGIHFCSWFLCLIIGYTAQI